LLGALVLVACAGAAMPDGHERLEPSGEVKAGRAGSPRDPLRWARPHLSEFYFEAPYRGYVRFDTRCQELELDLRASDPRRVECTLEVGRLRPGWIATAFTQPGPGRFLIAGVDVARDRGVVLLLELDPDTLAPVATHELCASGALRTPVSIDVLRDGERLAVLDPEGAALFVLDLASGALELVHRDPALRETRYVGNYDLENGGTSIMASVHPDVGMPLSRTLVTVYDEDGDGTFEGAFPLAAAGATDASPPLGR
jgi:hypothetical protein